VAKPYGTGKSGVLSVMAVPVLLLLIPIFDTTLVTISRSRRGLIPFTTPGKDHTAHRLANLGWGQRGAVLALYSLGVVAGAAAILVTYLSVAGALAVAAVAVAVMLGGVALLELAPYEAQKRKPAKGIAPDLTPGW